MKRLHTIILLSLFCSLHNSFSQIGWPQFKHITKDDGLASNRVLSITQDRSGFMWIGTEDGIARFDGSQFEIFRNDPSDKNSLCYDYVNCIYEDPINGNIWVATDKGLTCLNINNYKFYQDFKIPNQDSTLLNGRIFSILIDKNKNRWIGTLNGLYVYFYQSETPVIYGIKNKLRPSLNSVHCIFEDSKGNIWIGNASGLELFDPKTRTFKRQKYNTGAVNAIYEDSKNNLWLSTINHGVFHLTNGRTINYSKETGHLLNNKVQATVEDHFGNMYFAVRDGGGLHYLDRRTDRVRILSPDRFNTESINSSALTSIYKDRFENIWIGTWVSGINLIDRNYKPFVHFKVNFKENGLINNNIRSMFQDSDGEIWIGSKDGGCLSRFNSKTGTFTHYKHDPQNHNTLSSTYVFAINEASPGKLLIGNFATGLNLFDKKTNNFTHFTHNPANPKSVANDDIYAIFKDRYDTIWIATVNKLQKFDLKNRSFTTLNNIQYVKCFLDYNQDEIYFGSKWGLYLYNRKTQKIKEFQGNQGDSVNVSDPNITDLASDALGNVWIGTYRGGLNYLDRKTQKIKVYNTKDGLPSNLICAIETDKKGNLWISTTNGLSRFDPKTKKFRNYYVSDGIQGNEFERYVSLKTKDGHLLFGGSNGFTYFNPDSIFDNPNVPNVVLTDFQVFHKPVPVGKKSPLEKHITLTDRIVVNHKQTVISFEFVAINYSSPVNNQYAYKLEGFEKDWNYTGTKRNVTYTNLTPGTYEFKVMASNNDGIWNEKGASVQLIVRPPWWRTLVVKISAGILIAVFAVLIFNYRTKKLRKQKQKLELLVKERTHQIALQNEEIASQRDELIKLNRKTRRINELRLQFFTYISHEFRTPLSLILAPVDKLLSMAPNAETKHYLSMIKKNSDRLLHLINELMDFRSIETQNMPLRLTQSNIVKFVKDIAECFNDLAKQRNMAYKFETDIGELEACFDAVKLEKILYNLIANAFKYTPDNGTVLIKTRVVQLSKIPSAGVSVGRLVPDWKYFEVSIIDKGIGITEENLQRVFKEFYREPAADNQVGTGIGLAMTKELIKLHKGFIIAQSRKNEGSEFSVHIPVEKHCYEKQQIEQTVSDIKPSKLPIAALLENKNTKDEEIHLVNKNPESKILIVEDNEELRNFLVSELSVSYSVIEASNGASGLKLALKRLPDLIISDVVMPKTDGIQMCRLLKENIQTCHIPVILLTALSDVRDEIVGLESGADDYITKPFDITILLARINNLLHSRNKLKQLFSSSAEIIPAEVTSNTRDEKFLQKALDIVNENLSDPNFGVKEFVDKICMSRSVVHEKLVGLTNQSAIDFITTVRLKKAAQLLSNPNQSITDVAQMVGYDDPSYFSRCFKKMYGKTPKAYAESTTNS